jgi:hypothetical protein
VRSLELHFKSGTDASKVLNFLIKFLSSYLILPRYKSKIRAVAHSP